ncbi:MAG TPA: phosphoribosylanthranilate isomerase [Tepidisphaeraceae bacterium]|nr:phosphoribosylanthranilate isomerase [Tepidisphaeraceae bacterium]
MCRTRIKICGITRADDAKAAVAAGADAVGMIFHPPSPRNISIDRAREIVRALSPFVTAVGVFVDALTSRVMEVAAELSLSTVQLNGQEPVERIAQLRKQKLKVIKAVKVDANFEKELERWRGAMSLVGDMLAGLVLETGGTQQPGGTGVANDWERIKKLHDKGAFNGLPPLIAAGGLDAKNVKDVVRSLRPWAVDVSSGVESSLGHKSVGMIEDFVIAVRGADL